MAGDHTAHTTHGMQRAVNGCETSGVFSVHPVVQDHVTAHINGLQRDLGFTLESERTPDVIAELAALLYEHNRAAAVVYSDAYQREVERVTQLVPCDLGEKICGDGRVSGIAVSDGTVIKATENPAAMTDIEGYGARRHLRSISLENAVMETARAGRPLVEFLWTHSSPSDLIASSCLAAKIQLQAMHGGSLPLGIDIVGEHLNLLAPEGEVFLQTYNRGRQLHPAGGIELQRIVVFGNIDTDTMARELRGNDETSVLSTLDLAEQLFPRLNVELGFIPSQTPYLLRYIGAMRQTFTDVEHLLAFKRAVTDIALHLMHDDEFTRAVDTYMAHSALAALNEAQQKGVTYMMARNLGVLYVTGLYRERAKPTHHFALHYERAVSISLDGRHMLEFHPGIQALRTTPSGPEARAREALVFYAVMQSFHGHPPYPYFLVNSNARGVTQALAETREMYHDFVRDARIAALITQGRILPLPVIINRQRQIVDLPLYH